MTAPVVTDYEQQSDSRIHRGCGAACLSIVYRSFGMEVPQAGIWPLIAKQNRFGSIASTTYLMALHALNNGLSAVVIQARHPLQVLRLCREGGIRAILNHRPQRTVSTGHYTVFVDIDDQHVVLEDPSSGASRRMSHAELLQLWQPQSSASEIAGNVVIGIAREPAAIAACEFCHTSIPSRVDCPRCKKAVGLNPAALLGCIRDGCIARMWDYIACPSCDFMWCFNEAGTSTGDLPRATAAAGDSRIPALPDLDKTFALLDKFCAHLLSIPGAETHPGLKAQIDFIQGSKQPLLGAQVEELAKIRARLNRLTAAAEQSKQQEEARRKKMDERNAQLPPLDGNALGRALLKNLGFKAGLLPPR